MENRAVFLDRDGVINVPHIIKKKPYPPPNIEHLQIYDDVKSAISRFKAAGYIPIIVTNQPDVARGKTKKNVVEQINNEIMKSIHIEFIKCCFHDDEDYCFNRKPNPGALQESALEHNINLSKSYMIGDRWKDIEAGRRAGCSTMFIDRGYNELIINEYDHLISNLSDAALIIEEKNNA